jgi:hypothetical protein
MAVGMACPVAQVQVRHRAGHHADEQRCDIVEVVGVHEVEHRGPGEHLVAVAEQRPLGLADLVDLSRAVHQRDHVGARRDH